jgi:hypothetical protein
MQNTSSLKPMRRNVIIPPLPHFEATEEPVSMVAMSMTLVQSISGVRPLILSDKLKLRNRRPITNTLSMLMVRPENLLEEYEIGALRVQGLPNALKDKAPTHRRKPLMDIIGEY